jgi:hypothetical protein
LRHPPSCLQGGEVPRCRRLPSNSGSEVVLACRKFPAEGLRNFRSGLVKKRHVPAGDAVDAVVFGLQAGNRRHQRHDEIGMVKEALRRPGSNSSLHHILWYNQ